MALWPFRTKCPVDAQSRTWVNERMGWLAGEFGMKPWRTEKAIEPTDEFFPDRYDGSESAVDCMLTRICARMGVERQRIDLRFYSEERNRPVGHLHLETKGGGSAGHYRVEEKEIVALETSNLKDPMSIVATLAHELAHVRLLGEGRLNREEEDHEPLTDLATVFFGFGIFTANSASRFNQWASNGWSGWSSSRQGYLDQPMLGYAMGLWTVVRGEWKPRWLRHLHVNPRSDTRGAIRFLKANPPAGFNR